MDRNKIRSQSLRTGLSQKLLIIKFFIVKIFRLKQEEKENNMMGPSFCRLYSDNLKNFEILTEVDSDLKIAKPTVTAWGERVLEIERKWIDDPPQMTARDIKDSISLNTLARKLFSASEKRCEADDLTMAERVVGLDLLLRLTKLYEKSDKQVAGKNFFTRILVWIRDLFGPRMWDVSQVGYLARANFRAFSKDKLNKEFGSEFCREMEQETVIRHLKLDKLYVSDDTIRAKARGFLYWSLFGKASAF